MLLFIYSHTKLSIPMETTILRQTVEDRPRLRRTETGPGGHRKEGVDRPSDTKDSALEYNFSQQYSSASQNDNVISAYSDSDWGSDIQDRRSQAGWAIFYRNALIGWKSKKLPTISLSTAAAA